MAWVFLPVVTLLVYLPVWSAGFIWDDDKLMIYTPEQTSLHGLFQIWTNPKFMAQYYPLTFTSFWIEQKLWGLHPTGYHVINVLLHAGSAVLLWRLLRRLAAPGAYVAALLFALHPVNVESVAWVAERKNTLSTALYLLSATAFFTFAPAAAGLSDEPPRRRWLWYAAALLIYVGAVLSKSVTCSLPAAILVVTWWKHGRLRWRDAAPLVPMFIIGLIAGLNTAQMEKHGVGASGDEWAFSPAQRVLIAGRAVCFYAWKLLAPWPLSFNYERWVVDAGVLWQWSFPLIVLSVTAVLLVVALRGRQRGPLAGVLLFVGTLTPALGFFNLYPMRFSFVADHFQYLATIPMLALMTALATRGLKRLRTGDRLGIGVGAGMAIVYAGLSFVRAEVFHGNESLWRDTIAKSPNAWMPYDQMAVLSLAEGDTTAAINYAAQSLSLNPNQPEGHMLMGDALLHRGDAAGALAAYRKAAALRPDNFQVHRSIAKALYVAGDVDGAIAAYERAFALEPRFQQGRIELAEWYAALGRPAEAEAQLREAIVHNARSTGARVMLAGMLYRQGRVDEAIELMQQAIAIDDGNAIYHNNLGAFLESRGRKAEALRHYRRAAELNPNLTPAAEAARRLAGS